MYTYSGVVADVSMEELNRRIRGDWYEIQETADDIYALEDVFAFTVDELKDMVENLRLSVENGVTECKTATLSSIFSYLESLQYDSRGIDALPARARDVSFIVYASLIQRLIALGVVKIRSGSNATAKTPAAAGTESKEDLKEILKDIQERIQKDPNVRNHNAVKNIFMQVNMYKRELENMKKLAPNIPAEKQPGFYANFKQTFDKITAKARENHAVLLKEDWDQAAQEMPSTHPLKRNDLKPLAALFLDQAKEFSMIRSTLTYAGAERYKTRDILSRVIERRDRVNTLVAEETKRYGEMETGSGGGRSLSRAFAAEVIAVLNRQISRMS